MRDRFHLSNSAIFAVMWIALSGLVLHDISLRHQGGGSGTGVSDRVVTKEFMLVDNNGTTRARIGMTDKTNAPSVQLFDAAGAQRAQLRLNKDDVPSLRLYSGEGKLKSVVGFTLNDMRPTFVTFDANGVGHVENRSGADSYTTVQDEDLTGGRYVQSYHGTVDLYNGQTLSARSTNLHFTMQQAQSTADAARLQARLVSEQARMQAEQEVEIARQQAQQARQQAEQARMQAELSRQRAINDAINAAADKVNIESNIRR